MHKEHLSHTTPTSYQEGTQSWKNRECLFSQKKVSKCRDFFLKASFLHTLPW